MKSFRKYINSLDEVSLSLGFINLGFSFTLSHFWYVSFFIAFLLLYPFKFNLRVTK